MTILIVSHRPSFIAASDSIIDLQAGQIVGLATRPVGQARTDQAAPTKATA